jgi:[ribosomal protein S5]-alanine N-acetyltransferase
MIHLAPLAPIHAGALQPLLEDPAIAATTPFPHPYPPDGAAAYVEESIALRAAGTKYVYAISGPEGLPVGMALLKDVDRQKGEAELGYWIGRPYWSRGYATEAAAGMMAYGFETLGLQTILAVTLEANPSSLRVLEKLGFVELTRSTWALPKWPEPKPCITLRVSTDTWRAPQGLLRPVD